MKIRSFNFILVVFLLLIFNFSLFQALADNEIQWDSGSSGTQPASSTPSNPAPVSSTPTSGFSFWHISTWFSSSPSGLNDNQIKWDTSTGGGSGFFGDWISKQMAKTLWPVFFTLFMTFGLTVGGWLLKTFNKKYVDASTWLKLTTLIYGGFFRSLIITSAAVFLGYYYPVIPIVSFIFAILFYISFWPSLIFSAGIGPTSAFFSALVAALLCIAWIFLLPYLIARGQVWTRVYRRKRFGRNVAEGAAATAAVGEAMAEEDVDVGIGA